MNIKINYWWNIIKSNIDKLIFVKNNINNDNKNINLNFKIEKNMNEYYANNDFWYNKKTLNENDEFRCKLIIFNFVKKLYFNF